MKTRILELISTPENIVAEDLQLLKDEILVQPYAQSLRALYLLGTKKYDEENYQKVLATTAAYTTDKKILYQFINGKRDEPSITKTIPENPVLQPIEAETIIKNKDATPVIEDEKEAESNYLAEIPPRNVPEKVIIEGVVNRILFEGEENFLEEEAIKIDVEATVESGVLVAENKAHISNENMKSSAIMEKSPEKFKEDLLSLKSEIFKEKSIQEINGAEKSPVEFRELESGEIENRILDTKPEIKKEQNTTVIKTENTTENKYEIERKKLAEEIERKISERKRQPKKIWEEEIFEDHNANVDFHETQDFSLDKTKLEENITEEKNIEDEAETASIQNIENNSTEIDPSEISQNSEWKPMSQADKISSKSRFSAPENEKLTDAKTEESTEENPETFVVNTTEKEVQPLNISFFAPTISEIKEKTKEEIPAVETEKEITTVGPAESNIPTFINTWQNWLKLDHSNLKLPEDPKISKEKIKSEAIEKFIDTAPKISKLKEEVNFTVKEKKDDINHLMTETLAKLFLTQKLYSKAIKAYKTLQEKHPEKSEEFEMRIEEIKVLRQK